MLATVAVGKSDGSTGLAHPVIGHEGSWAPDGLTYYGGDLRYAYTVPGSTATATGQYYAVDTTDPTHPSLITAWTINIAASNVHGMSISDDGNRGYFVSLGTSGGASGLTDPNQPANDGLLIYDLSQIQARVPNPQVRLVSKLLWKDGSGAQHTIAVKIDGKPYVIFVDEAGSGGFSSAAQRQAACAAGFPPYPMARIIDIRDETKPRIVSRLALETHNPANCAKVLPDLVGLSIFTYGSHYCSVDNIHHATTLACGYFNSGIRVFDIRNPRRPKEIAYYNPAGQTTWEQLRSGRSGLVLGAGAPADFGGSRPAGDAVDYVPGQRAADAEVRKRSVAVRGQLHAAGSAELARRSIRRQAHRFGLRAPVAVSLEPPLKKRRTPPPKEKP